MNLDAIIARAAPPPERVGGPFEPVATDPDSLELRRRHMVEAFGSASAAAAHAEAVGVEPEAWFGRLGDVRIDGDDPSWALEFREIYEYLLDGPLPFRAVRRWARARIESDWPAVLPRGPDALEGFLDYLAARFSQPINSVLGTERRLGLAPSWDERLRRSPVLGWLLGRVAADWLADVNTIVRRAATDRFLFARAFFGAEDPGRLLKVEPGLGDSHDGGRSVAILRFERGSVVYKPKDLRVAAAVREIAVQVGEPGVDGPSMLLRDGYAWEAEYQARPVAAPEDADAFYRALGGWLALLQGLGAVDFWFDNLIAEGATPRFIDFETAIQPLGFMYRPGGAVADLARLDPATVGILPLLFVSGDGEEPIDLGCLTRPGKQRIPGFVAGDSPGTWEESRFAPHRLGGKSIDVADHFEAFEEGYLRVARTLRDSSLQTRLIGVLRRWRDASIRIILIDTWTCYSLIRSSLAFGNLGDGVWREIVLHRMVSRTADVKGWLRESAVAGLRRLDVPLFQTRLDSRDLFGTERGRRSDLFPLDALSEVPRRLRVLAAAPEEQRLGWLRSSFGLRADNPPRRPPGKGTFRPASAGNLLEWANAIATDIERQVESDDRGGPLWIGACIHAFSGWRGIVPLGQDILSGRAGLALALLELASGLERPGLATLACEALENAALEYIESPGYLDSSGFVVGVGGLIAALARVPALRPLAGEVYRAGAAREVWMKSGGDFVSGLEGWCRAASAVGEPAPLRHGPGRPYAPAILPRLAPWLDVPNAAPFCPDRRTAARLRQSRERQGTWFGHLWLDDRHNLSGVDGLPALAVQFVRLAASEPVIAAIPEYLR